MGEDLQWGKVCNGFFSTIEDLPGGRSAMGGGEVCNITPGLPGPGRTGNIAA